MSRPIHLLVRASAGTGKTYVLSSRYLELLLSGVDPDRVLATTFTRKAAHEILDRIVERLAQAAPDTERGRKKLAELSRSIGRAASAEECLASLERLLRGMDRIRIGTIDSFFAQLARLFALDLGLPPAWRIADEAESELLRSEAVADAVARAGRVELLDLLRDFQRQAVGQGAHRVLLDFAGRGREVMLESAPEAWTCIRALPVVERGELEAAIEALAEFPVPRNKDRSESKDWRKALQGIRDLAGEHEWIGLLEKNGLIKKICSRESSYSRKPIAPNHVEALRPILGHALHVLTSRLVVQNSASRALLERFEESYRALSRARGLLRFEDVSNALAPVSSDDPLVARGVDLAHRIDGKIDHLLLDEFQDTAPVQWRVLRPLADGIVSDGSGERSFFCVGDEKQSIYGWRAAEPRLLRELDRKRPTLRKEELKKSYRSSRAVLGAVNLVFATIAQNPAFAQADPEVIAAAEEFQGSFVEHEPNADRPGAVHLVRARPHGVDEPEHLPVLGAAVERVGAILDDAPRATIGVLVRRRAWIPDLIRRLRDAGIAASDEGGNPLTDSMAVLHALSLLHLGDHPGDTAAAFHVANSPFGRVVGLDPALFAAGRRDPSAGRGALDDAVLARIGAAARGVRARLAAQGYGGFLASIRPGEGYGGWDLERYEQLVDLALAWEGRAGSRPRAFVEHVRKTKVEDRSAAQVRVMTVHGAKGLEFDAVLLPELDRSMSGRGDALLTMRPDPEGAIEVVSHGIRKEIAPAHAQLDEVRRDVARRRMVEELCVLYVAMTRAIHRLDLIVQGRDKEGGGLTNAAIFRKAFDVDAAGPEGVAWSHPERTEPWFREEIGPAPEKLPAAARAAPAATREARGAPGGAPAAARETPSLRLAPARRSRSTASRSPSQAKDLDLVAPSRLLLPRDAMTARGRIVHRLLQEVDWIETFDRSDEELLALARRIDADEKLVASALAEFRASLARPETKRLLSQSDPPREVWRERPFSLFLPDTNGIETLWTGAFDRVVLRREGGMVVSAEIVDFKTDRVEGEAIRARAESYRAQMHAYRRALAHITGLTETAIRLRLAFLAPDAVEDL